MDRLCRTWGTVDQTFLSCPPYLLTGEYDLSCSPEDTLLTAATIPGVSVEVIQEVGHFPMSENPAQSRKYLMPVLESIHRQMA